MALRKLSLRSRIRLVSILILLATAGLVARIRASVMGPAANAVLGEAVFDTSFFVTPSSVAGTAQMTIDAAGHLYLADLSNNRVLGWHSATGFANNDPADVVIGQLDFLHVYPNQGGGVATSSTLDSPQGVATDSDGNLYVADTLNNRVTEYTSPFAGFVGIPIVGQSANFIVTATNLGLGESQSFNEPVAVAVDSNKNLFVSELGNSRILEFFDPIATGVSCTPNSDGSGCAGDAVVDAVLGQPSLTGTLCNNGGLGAATLCLPYGLAVDAGTNNLYVADMDNSRVLVFPAPISTGENAAQVWGQPNFLSNIGGLGPDLFEAPDGVALDSAHNLYVSDSRNERALEYPAALPYPGTSPATAWGTGNATDCNHGGNCGGIGFLGAMVLPNEFEGVGIAIDNAGGLYIADTCNQRVLVFDNALAPTESGTRVLGQADLNHGLYGNEIFDASTLGPNSLVVDSQGHLYVLDSGDSRVLGWHNASSFADGQPADVVIGQPDFISFISNQDSIDGTPNAATLSFPNGIAVDFKDNLYVADEFNARVLEHDTPCAGWVGSQIAGQSASRLWGQGTDFTGENCNQGGISASTLCNPAAVVFDSAHNLYIADGGNSRGLEYPYSAGDGFASTAAATVFGIDSSGTNFSTHSGCPGASSISMCFPAGLALDSKDNLIVSDSGHNRIMIFNTPLNGSSGEAGAGDVTADEVIGQPDFVSRSLAHSVSGLSSPQQLATDAADDLYVADSNNNRVLEYLHNGTSGFPDTAADSVWGQPDFLAFHCNEGTSFPSQTGLCFPNGVAVDSTGILYIADAGNNRVLRYGSGTPNPTPTATATSTPTATATSTP